MLHLVRGHREHVQLERDARLVLPQRERGVPERRGAGERRREAIEVRDAPGRQEDLDRPRAGDTVRAAVARRDQVDVVVRVQVTDDDGAAIPRGPRAAGAGRAGPDPQSSMMVCPRRTRGSRCTPRPARAGTRRSQAPPVASPPPRRPLPRGERHGAAPAAAVRGRLSRRRRRGTARHAPAAVPAACRRARGRPRGRPRCAPRSSSPNAAAGFAVTFATASGRVQTPRSTSFAAATSIEGVW